VGASTASLNVSLPARIADIIERAIFARTIKPGQWLREVELADTLAVSRTPVREAFQILSRKGLVDNLPRRGVRVRSVSAQEMQWFLAIRGSLDGLAARLAATHITSESLAALKLLLHEQRSAVTNKQNERFAELGARFHELIYEVSGNQRLLLLYRSIITEGALFRIQDLSQLGGMQKSLFEHRRLFAAIQSRNAVRAQMLAEKHIVRVLDQLLRN